MDRLRRWWWIGGLAIAVIVVIVLAPLASGDPDGLESVAEREGFIGSARDAIVEILPDYTIPGLDDPTTSTILAGLAGIAIVFLVMVALGRLLRRRRPAA